MPMWNVAQTSSPMVRPCSLAITMSSRHARSSCSAVLNTSGPMKPATSLTIIHAPVCSTDVSRDAVGARLERHHVDAFGRAVGDRRSLARLEVQPVEAPREIEHAVDVEADHARERPRRSGQALEPDVDGRALARLCCLTMSESTQ